MLTMQHDEQHSPDVDTMTIRRIAVDTATDPRSVAREIRGERVRGIAGERIRRALRTAGLPTSDSREVAA
jgi:hypothetical protein